MKMQTLEVRSDTNPSKVLGFIDLPAHRIVERNSIVVKVEHSFSFVEDPRESFVERFPKRYVFELTMLEDDGRKYLAVKAREIDIEILKKLSGFRETRYEGGSNRPALKAIEGSKRHE